MRSIVMVGNDVTCMSRQSNILGRIWIYEWCGSFRRVKGEGWESDVCDQSNVMEMNERGIKG